jgi:hypothetical protein
VTVSSIVPFPVEFTATAAPCTRYVTPRKKKQQFSFWVRPAV